MLYLLAMLLVLALPTVFVAVFAKMGWGFFRPKNNIEYIVLRGGIRDHSIRGYTDFYTKRGNDPDVEPKEHDSSLYRLFGICYFGIPFIYKIGTIIVNYPPQLRSTSGLQHATNDTAPGFDIHHNYLLEVKGVEFQGGVAFDLEFSLEAELVRPDVAWGRNGKFLESLGQHADGAINQSAITINATDFVGKKTKQIESTGEASEKEKEMRKKADKYRGDLCNACMKLNINTNKSNRAAKIGLAEICGYEIRSISFKGLKTSDANSKKRLDLLEDINESFLKTDLAEQNRKTATIEADSAAIKLKSPAMAQVEVNKAAGMADAEVSKAKKDAVGQELMTAELNAKAIENNKGTLVMGGGGMPQVILPLK